MTLGAQSSRNRIQDVKSDKWVKYPITYDEWNWVPSCTNTQFDADTSGNVAPLTLKDTNPKCAVVNNALVITMTEDLTSTDYTTFKMKFKISVKMPRNFIGSGTTVDAIFSDPNSNNVYAAADQITGFLSVTKPAGQKDTDGSALVSFGVDPNNADEIARGVGIYSAPFCLTHC